MRTFRVVIDAFGGPAKFGAAIGIPAGHARVMKFRDSISPNYWSDIVSAAAKESLSAKNEAAKARFESITIEMLAGCAARNRSNHSQRRAA